MILLRGMKASLGTYEDVMRWHLIATGLMSERDSIAKQPKFISRQKLFNFLKKRYNRDQGFNMTTEIVLPLCKAKAKIIHSDAKMVIQSLLTDPRIRPSDYLFFGDNDPLAGPPNNLNHIADINTGKSYRMTYKQYIENGDFDVLLPVIIYIDGTATGHFANLPITPVKIALGIHNGKARERAHTWGTLGYIPAYRGDKSRGRRLFIDSGHVDGTMAYHESLQDEGELDGKEAVKAQDLHTILDKIFESFVEIQNSGFYWDLQIGGKKHQNLKMKPYVAFVRADTDEADKLSGQFGVKTRNVKMLCRKCLCPTNRSDDPRANYNAKTVRNINKLVSKDDVAALKLMSQQPIENAMDKLDFGYLANIGIHGCTPFEMLYFLLLGIFKDV